MKLAFSTLGCPDWKFSEILSTAKDLSFNGFEVRGIASEMCAPKIRAFDSEHIDANIKKLADANIEISMLTSGVCGGDTDKDVNCIIEEAKEYIDLAQKLYCKYIRVMISSKPQPEETNIEHAKNVYNIICEYAKDKNVVPLIETNGVLSDSIKMKEFIESIDCANKGVLWDIHHPFRFFNETPETTFSHIGKYVKYVHIKDSIIKDDKINYRMMGYGDIPAFDALKILKSNGYDGYVSLEWVKRWNPDLEEAGIVFAHFMSYISFLIERI